MAKKRRQIRADFRKNRTPRARQNEWTRRVHRDGTETPDDMLSDERLSGKGDLTRKRTITSEAGSDHVLDVDDSTTLRGRVLRAHGLTSTVETEDGTLYECATRRLLKTLTTDQRHVVAAGDLVVFRPSGKNEGIIERIEPRHGVLSRTSKRRQHVIVANVDQLVIVSSAAEPYLKPNLIDRYLVHAERSGIPAVICINKIDLVEPESLAALVGVYSQMGYPVFLVSARSGLNIERFRRQLAGRESVVSGQSGVGKSSLLNAIEPGFDLRVRAVSAESQKGRHTTTTAEVLRLASGGYVVDTPGLRQFQLWDIVPEEVAGFYRDLRPFVSRCRFPDCTHTHEDHCAVKDAVADGWLDARRYESYCQLREGDTT
ncbi:MAG TPA: ribosome small subunit-dependent GTPase A [Pirellulales bacterium]|jgi:ribosome biogenesis GTPase|nr:ribosome small subunit-dependent GTPase A [Pirellulales bacterium]